MNDNTNETEEELVFKDGIPSKEIDEPLNFDNCANCQKPDSLNSKKVEIEEKDKDRKEKRYFSAFKLIVGCLIFLGLIYIIEVISSAILRQELTGVTDNVIEIIKTLLFTLSGYLFARKENGD